MRKKKKTEGKNEIWNNFKKERERERAQRKSKSTELFSVFLLADFFQVKVKVSWEWSLGNSLCSTFFYYSATISRGKKMWTHKKPLKRHTLRTLHRIFPKKVQKKRRSFLRLWFCFPFERKQTLSQNDILHFFRFLFFTLRDVHFGHWSVRTPAR